MVAAHPLVARAVLIEAFAPGGEISAQYEENLRRFVDSIDSARLEPDASHCLPPLTARFMLGAIDAAVRRLVGLGEADRAESMLDDLTHFVVLTYFGAEAAATVAVG